MLSALIRLGLLAGFVIVARRILSPEAPPPRLAPPRGERGRKPRAQTSRRSVKQG